MKENIWKILMSVIYNIKECLKFINKGQLNRKSGTCTQFTKRVTQVANKNMKWCFTYQ